LRIQYADTLYDVIHAPSAHESWVPSEATSGMTGRMCSRATVRRPRISRHRPLPEFQSAPPVRIFLHRLALELAKMRGASGAVAAERT